MAHFSVSDLYYVFLMGGLEDAPKQYSNFGNPGDSQTAKLEPLYGNHGLAALRINLRHNT